MTADADPIRDAHVAALDATIIIATRHRPALLRSTLAHLARQAADRVTWDVVVADNGGDDATAAVLAEARERLPLTVVREPQPGKNRALNRAVPFARGELLVFTDDDVEPVPEWLAEHVRAGRRWPSHAVFGGPIVPRFPPGTPSWLATHPFAVAAFGRFQPAVDEGPCAGPPFGSNWAVRAARMAGLAFREDFGPRGGATDLMGGDTELLQRLLGAGERAVFVPSAGICHVIQPHQTTPAWLFQRAFRHGRTYRRLGDGRRRRLASSRMCARFAARWLVRVLATAADEPARIRAGIALFHTRGQLYEDALARRTTRPFANLLVPSLLTATSPRPEG